ncbi:MAG: DNA alkylation repair protein [Prevotellaceae bacterium]|nr:DNA alkylation repair protein [Prevotellaceae bacterium]
MKVKADDIIATLISMGDEWQRENLMRFFKTGKGQYGEGDRFIGIKVPDTRMVVKEARLRVPLDEIAVLLDSEWHEARLCGFLLLVEEMKAALPKARQPLTANAGRRDEIARFYLRHARSANNWDLVDMSCPKILGKWLLYPQADGTMPDRQVLYRLAASSNLWEQRIAIVTCWMLIRSDDYDDTLRLATQLLPHPHDLIHKAVGWMLREVGKRDMTTLEDYLDSHAHEMHRTTLRYAIEKMSEEKRRYYLS